MITGLESPEEKTKKEKNKRKTHSFCWSLFSFVSTMGTCLVPGTAWLGFNLRWGQAKTPTQRVDLLVLSANFAFAGVAGMACFATFPIRQGPVKDFKEARRHRTSIP